MMAGRKEDFSALKNPNLDVNLWISQMFKDLPEDADLEVTEHLT